MGITRGKWGTLINAFLRFKEDYDNNASLEKTIPNLVKSNPDRYLGMGLKDLCSEMFEAMKTLKTTKLLAEAFSVLPVPDMTPTKAYEHLVRNNIESVALDQAANRTLATGIVPYPPGIPLLMPGENAGPADGPILGYLNALQEFDRKFPCFGHDNHGVDLINGSYVISVVKK